MLLMIMMMTMMKMMTTTLLLQIQPNIFQPDNTAADGNTDDSEDDNDDDDYENDGHENNHNNNINATDNKLLLDYTRSKSYLSIKFHVIFYFHGY